MISFSSADIIVIISFFLLVLAAGFISGRKTGEGAEEYLLSGRKVGLFLFVLTNVSTWYGGILGVGEFTYLYGLASWFTQGFPYYIFAVIFALLFAKKIRQASLFTIPDKLTEVYGRPAGLLSAVFVFILVSPAPYILMAANLISVSTGFGIAASILITLLVSLTYLLKGGFKADLYTDVVQFFVMFAGFIIIVIFAYSSFGGGEYLTANLPPEHLELTGGASPLYILVWFLIALWTFADPGFHQRCYAAKSGDTAVKGIIISVFFWMLFDFLTNTTGLYARAALPGLQNPQLSFPLLAEQILPSGYKGIFYAAMFATIISTLNSFLFLSGTTIGRDFIYRLNKEHPDSRMKSFTLAGLLISGAVSAVMAYLVPSVIELWYTIGSFCIPAVILPVISAYYPALRISGRQVVIEMAAASGVSILWYFIRYNFGEVSVIEPMLAGLITPLLLHLFFLLTARQASSSS